ncbi:type II toxin-antitoxin system RatA family toxin [Alteromonas sp. 5E99-2]|uniref:type II toxin-antitoxin system RatA family toxin n=1 Tax=Alteromonas sp. 5E99-2 TaxID=2817683 RepID=UPI001A989F30|nr:type II toxin-antitoxin system RatA family toxin [Alteromonas sp. 5E99-2]MBO1255651.1 type II toxin-antitoxin system RatA family toxin [Alteromonas sp. 5E99-2]
MAHVQRTALVPFSAESMYNLVNDVDGYADFLPGCADSRIDEQSDTHMQASLLIKKAGISQWFSTRNTLEKNTRIGMSLVNGPFKSLEGGWTFIALDEKACKIELNLQFEFESRLVEAAFGKVFESITRSMINAFTQRAKEVYS